MENSLNEIKYSYGCNPDEIYNFGTHIDLSGSKPEDFVLNFDMCDCTLPPDDESVLNCQ